MRRSGGVSAVRAYLTAASIALAAALTISHLAQAAATATEESSSEKALEEVVVTGSRLAAGFATPTPVTTITAENLAAAVPNNIGEALAQLPSLAGSVQNSSSATGSGVSRYSGQNVLNLRRLGPGRTLVLMDGLRLGVTNVVGAVDINIIPQNLVKRVDVVTGGASASYGSDAVAGVVNFILDTGFKGFKVDINGGITDKSDAANGKASVTFGMGLGARGRLVGAGEVFTMNGMRYGELTHRDWFDHPIMSVRNASGAVPTWLLIPDTRSHFGSYGGTITGVLNGVTGTAKCTAAACTSLLLQQFQPDGTLIPFHLGNFVFGNNRYVSGGDGVPVNQPFTPDSDRYSLFLHGEFDVNDNVTLWAQGGYNLSETHINAQVLQLQAIGSQGNQWRIFEDNAFLPAGVAEALASVPGTQSFYMSRYARDMGFNEVVGNVRVKRFVGGAKGIINDRWSYDASTAYQITHQDENVRTARFRNLYAAADAVRHPITGQIVCRSQWYDGDTFVPAGTGRDPDCVPANVFGDGNVSQAATDYIMHWNSSGIDLKQFTFDANLRGDLGDRITLGAGPINLAVGMNYRRLTADRVVDPFSAIYKDGTGIRGFPNQQGSYGGYTYFNPSPLSGKVSVTEGYVEFGVPLLRDRLMVKELTTTLAGRMTDYSQSGVENMWKLGLNWTINDYVRFRSTMSKDTRAPTVLELFDTGYVFRGTLVLPGQNAPGAFPTDNIQTTATGNPRLTPESARTYTLGFVLAPSFLPRFQASVDWYLIKLLNAIQSPSSQEIVDRCYAGNATYCSLITANAHPITTTEGLTPTDYIAVLAQMENVPIDQQISGVDLEAAYQPWVSRGDLTLRLLGRYALKMYNPNNDCAAGARGKTNDLVGAIGDCGLNPKILGTLSAQYDIGQFGIYLQERYIDKGKRNPNYVTGIDISNNEIPAIWYTDMTLSYKLGSWRGGTGQVYFNAENVFDKAPPPTNSTAGRSWVDVSDPSLYDFLGRRYVLGIRYSR